jgi:molybdopterin biosynthesis enzyme
MDGYAVRAEDVADATEDASAIPRNGDEDHDRGAGAAGRGCDRSVREH